MSMAQLARADKRVRCESGISAGTVARRRLKAVPIRRKSRIALSFPNFVLFAVILAGFALFNATQKALIAQGSIDLSRLKEEYSSAKELNDSLKLERAKLASPQRITQIATEKLKMVRPGKVSYLRLESPGAGDKRSMAMAGGSEGTGFLDGLKEWMGAFDSSRPR